MTGSRSMLGGMMLNSKHFSLMIVMHLFGFINVLSRSKGISCLQCADTNTRALCNRGTVSICPEGNICVKTLTRAPTNRVPKFSSQCESKCVEQDENEDRCRNVSVAGPSTACRQCCTIESCGQKFTEFSEQTRDLVFRSTLVYNTRPSLQCMSQNLKNASAHCLTEIRKIKHLFGNLTTSFPGGLDFVVERFEPFGDLKHIARITILVTVWKNATSLGEIKRALENPFKNPPPKWRYTHGIDMKHPVLLAKSEKLCPASERLLGNGVVVQWPASYQGNEVSALCGKPSDFDPSKFATLRCQPGGIWGSADTRRCGGQIQPLEQPIMESSHPTSLLGSVTLDFVNRLIEKNTKRNQLLSRQEFDLIIKALHRHSSKNSLAEIKIPRKVLTIVSQLVKILDLNDIYKEFGIPHKLRTIINRVKENLLLQKDHFHFKSDNMAFVVSPVSKVKTYNYLSGTGVSGRNNEVELNITTNNSPSSIDAFVKIRVPMKAIFESLNYAEMLVFDRLSISMFTNSALYDVRSSSHARQGQFGVSDDKPDTKGIINSWIVEVGIPGLSVVHLKENITLTYHHLKKQYINPQCVYWDDTNGAWRTERCMVVNSDDESTSCGCNLLTSFSLLVDVHGSSVHHETHIEILSWISLVGLSISITSLLITLITYCLFEGLRSSTRSHILIHLCTALLMANIVFLVAMQGFVMGNEITCKIVAILLHYFMLASFTWMLTSAFYLYLAFVHVFRTEGLHFLFKISLSAWGIPMMVVIVTVIVSILVTETYDLHHLHDLCWLKSTAFYFAFVAPVAIVLLFNCFVFFLVVRKVMCLSRDSLFKTNSATTLRQLRGAAGVCTLFGLTWVLAFVSIYIESIIFSYLSSIFNCLQGLFIFIFYCVLSNDAPLHWKRFIRTTASFNTGIFQRITTNATMEKTLERTGTKVTIAEMNDTEVPTHTGNIFNEILSTSTEI